MITLGLTLLFAIIVVVGALLGLERGLNKSVIRIITLVVAIVVTLLIVGPISTKIVQSISFDGVTIGEMLLDPINSSEGSNGIMDLIPMLKDSILIIPVFVLSIVLFPLMFVLISFISWIVYLIVQKPLRKLLFKDDCQESDDDTLPTGVRVGKRLGGMGIGIISGVLVFGMLMLPAFGLFKVLPNADAVNRSLDTIVEQGVLNQEEADDLKEAYAVTDCGVVGFYNLIGVNNAGRAYMNSVSKIETNDQTLYLTDEFGAFASIIQKAAEGGIFGMLQGGSVYNVLVDTQFTDELMNDMFSSKLLCSAVPEVMAWAMEGAANSMNVPANKEEVYNDMLESIAGAINSSDIDYAVIKSYEQSHPVVFALLRNAVPEKMTESSVTVEEYEAQLKKLDKLTDNISSIINKAMLGENGVFTDSVAKHIVNEIKTRNLETDKEKIDDINEYGVKNMIAAIDSKTVDSAEGNSDKLLEQLCDPEKFETGKATVETIKESVRRSVKNAVSDDSKASETASTLAIVVSDFASAVSGASKENGGFDAAGLNYEKLANAVTVLQNSTLKEAGSSVLDIVVSGDLGDNAILGNVINAVKDGYEKGEDIGGTIGTAGALIGIGTAMNGDNGDDQEAVVNSLTDLINNLNDFTIGLLPSIFTDDTITSIGVPKEYADTTYSIIETLLKELMKLKDEEDYSKEANSIISLYGLATSGVEEFTEEDVDKFVGYAIDSDAIFNTLISISASDPFGINITDQEKRTELIDAIEDHYEQSGKTDREKDIYKAVAKLLGLDEEVKIG